MVDRPPQGREESFGGMDGSYVVGLSEEMSMGADRYALPGARARVATSDDVPVLVSWAGRRES